MVRLLVRQIDGNTVVHLEAPADISFKTFDIEAPELEAYLRENCGACVYRNLIGGELLDSPQEGK